MSSAIVIVDNSPPPVIEIETIVTPPPAIVVEAIVMPPPVIVVEVLSSALGGTGNSGTTSWYAITDKPETFQPAPHTHQPSDLGSGARDGTKFLRDDGTWQAVAAQGSGPQQHVILLAFPNTFQLGQMSFRHRNVFGKPATLKRVFLEVLDAPIGANVIVDLHLDGTTIYTNQDDRPHIHSGEIIGDFVIPDIVFPSGSYIQAIVDQTGLSVIGSNLELHIVYEV